MRQFIWAILAVLFSSPAWGGTYLIMHPPGATFEPAEYDQVTLYGETAYTGMISMEHNGVSYVIAITDETTVVFAPKMYEKPLPNGSYPEGYMLFKKGNRNIWLICQVHRGSILLHTGRTDCLKGFPLANIPSVRYCSFFLTRKIKYE